MEWRVGDATRDGKQNTRRYLGLRRVEQRQRNTNTTTMDFRSWKLCLGLLKQLFSKVCSIFQGRISCSSVLHLHSTCPLPSQIPVGLGALRTPGGHVKPRSSPPAPAALPSFAPPRPHSLPTQCGGSRSSQPRCCPSQLLPPRRRATSSPTPAPNRSRSHGH